MSVSSVNSQSLYLVSPTLEHCYGEKYYTIQLGERERERSSRHIPYKAQEW